MQGRFARPFGCGIACVPTPPGERSSFVTRAGRLLSGKAVFRLPSRAAVHARHRRSRPRAPVVYPIRRLTLLTGLVVLLTAAADGRPAPRPAGCRSGKWHRLPWTAAWTLNKSQIPPAVRKTLSRIHDKNNVGEELFTAQDPNDLRTYVIQWRVLQNSHPGYHFSTTIYFNCSSATDECSSYFFVRSKTIAFPTELTVYASGAQRRILAKGFDAMKSRVSTESYLLSGQGLIGCKASAQARRG